MTNTKYFSLARIAQMLPRSLGKSELKSTISPRCPQQLDEILHDGNQLAGTNPVNWSSRAKAMLQPTLSNADFGCPDLRWQVAIAGNELEKQ
ncbi:hypothetical protein N9D23_00270 [Rubripirellula sp.]|jgi:hypothetical protein|nr:hypothetical protein [Planctomycetaceae bacterium]MDA9856526.1 hypothetical protein [Rubripirellula sp.]MDF1841144.1 hypothetical protein [Rubripirellula sp.]